MATDRPLVAAMIASYPTIAEGIAAAKVLMIAAGRTEDAAAKEIEGCLKEVESTKLKILYEAFKGTITELSTAFASTLVEAGHVPDTVEQFEIQLAYTPVELKIKNDQIVQPGGYVSRVRIKEKDGDNTWKVISSIGKQTRGGGNGGGRNVLCPKDAPFRSWRVLAEARYRVVDETPNYDLGELKIGTGYSAPDQLTKVGDSIYSFCKVLKNTEDRQATWEEVLENVDDTEAVVAIDFGD